jgi:hypothetical protein
MGEHFRIFTGGSAGQTINEETTCTVTIQGNVENATNKDVVGSWNMEQMTSKQWNIQVEDQDASLASLRALITAFNSDNKLTVGWDESGGSANKTAQLAAFARSGYAILSDLTISANNRQTVTVSQQYLGSGAIN